MGDPPTQADRNIRTNVTLLLQERGWSVNDLAEATGIPAQRLKRLLQVQESLHLKDAWLMARALNVEVTDLVYAGPAEINSGD